MADSSIFTARQQELQGPVQKGLELRSKHLFPELALPRGTWGKRCSGGKAGGLSASAPQEAGLAPTPLQQLRKFICSFYKARACCSSAGSFCGLPRQVEEFRILLRNSFAKVLGYRHKWLWGKCLSSFKIKNITKPWRHHFSQELNCKSHLVSNKFHLIGHSLK